MRIAVLRAPGTNCDRETARAVREAGGEAFVVHVGDLERGEDLLGYHGLVIPGGFSYGDRIRAGAVMAARLRTRLARQLGEFVASGRPVLGVCNGFQVLVELGFLPGPGVCRAALAPNGSARFECRWVILKRGRGCRFPGLPELLAAPVAHSEGRLVLEDGCLEEVEEKGLVAYRYALPDGSRANGVYPYNPNGSQADIAGLCSPEGNVLGLMPHPERAVYGWQTPPVYRPPRGLEVFRALVRAAELR